MTRHVFLVAWRWKLVALQVTRHCQRTALPKRKIHIKFCKRNLEVNNKASNVPCRAELGRYLLLLLINHIHLISYNGVLNNCMIHHLQTKAYISSSIITTFLSQHCYFQWVTYRLFHRSELPVRPSRCKSQYLIEISVQRL